MKKITNKAFLSVPGGGVKIKICGLSRLCDVDFVNEAAPDCCGFIIDVPKSRRTVTISKLKELRLHLAPSVLPIGVFVNAPADTVASLLEDGTIQAAQLHGAEDEAYLASLRTLTDAPVIQAFSIAGPEDIQRAEISSADYVLLDNGAGGTGNPFDWQLLKGLRRPFILAGGLTPENLSSAVQAAEAILPTADRADSDASRRLVCLDLNSGVETNGYKDREKIIAAVAAVRRINYE